MMEFPADEDITGRTGCCERRDRKAPRERAVEIISDLMAPSPENKDLSCWFAQLLQRQRTMRGAQAALDAADAPTKPRARGSMTRAGLTLADLHPGECGYVSRLLGSTQGRLRLLEMGLTPGTHVKVVRAAAFRGPLDIQVRGYQLSLRRDEAAAVWLGDQEEDGT